MKTFIFLVCKPDGTSAFADIVAANPADAVRQVVKAHAGCRFNIVSVTKL